MICIKKCVLSEQQDYLRQIVIMALHIDIKGFSIFVTYLRIDRHLRRYVASIADCETD